MAGQLYSDNLGIGCCSDLCDRQSDSHDRDACSEECVAPGYCQAQYGSETACIGTEPREQSVFDRLVSFDESAVHIPVNIFENGKRCTGACESVGIGHYDIMGIKGDENT